MVFLLSAGGASAINGEGLIDHETWTRSLAHMQFFGGEGDQPGECEYARTAEEGHATA